MADQDTTTATAADTGNNPQKSETAAETASSTGGSGAVAAASAASQSTQTAPAASGSSGAAAISTPLADVHAAVAAVEAEHAAAPPTAAATPIAEVNKAVDAVAIEQGTMAAAPQASAAIGADPGHSSIAPDPAPVPPAPKPLTPVQEPRSTMANLEAKFGPAEHEIADALKSVSPQTLEAPFVVPLTTIEESLPHPTVPHVFAGVGRMYNEGAALAASLEHHVGALEGSADAEVHAMLARLQTLIGDFRSGVEAIEGAISPKLRAGIEALHNL